MTTSQVGNVAVVDLGSGENRLTPDVVAPYVWSNGLDLAHIDANPSEFFAYLPEVDLGMDLTPGEHALVAAAGLALGLGE